MIIDGLVLELKKYLKIKETDVENDSILTQAAQLATGYIVANYSYHILDASVDKNFFLETLRSKFYLDASPVSAVTAFIANVEVTDNPNTVIDNVVYFDDQLGAVGDLIKLTATVGVDVTNPKSIGDIAQCVALAAYFYKNADKGLDGVMQYGTGIKESARLFEGIPKAILNYFETRRVYRF